MGPSWASLGLTWLSLASSERLLGPSWDVLGLEALADVSGVFWGLFGAFSADRRPSEGIMRERNENAAKSIIRVKGEVIRMRTVRQVREVKWKRERDRELGRERESECVCALPMLMRSC